MKADTIGTINTFMEEKKIYVSFENCELKLEHSLSQEEILKIVQAEYGNSITQNPTQLFELILKKLTTNRDNYDKLSIL